MSHTVVGVFDTSNEAQTSLQRLLSSGFERSDLDIAPQTVSDTANGGQNEDNDSIGNFFQNLFGGDDRSERYSGYARTGAIVTVHAKSAQEADRAADILDECGAVNLDERTSGTAASDTSRGEATSSGTVIPVIEEEMHVGKRTVESGGVRVRSRIIERPIEEHLRLREEHINVERNAVNRPATERDFSSFKEGETKMTEHTEVPMVEKEARVVGEVSVSKEVVEHDETVEGTVHNTDVDVDQLTEEELRRRRTDGSSL